MSYVQAILDYVHPAHAAAQHIVLPKNIYQNKFVFGLTLLFISNSQKVETEFRNNNGHTDRRRQKFNKPLNFKFNVTRPRFCSGRKNSRYFELLAKAR